MVDVVTPEKRSQMMARIRAKDTKPELVIRSGLHKLGYRFRLHDSCLPGKPDLVLRKYNAAIFVHGCFWHVHECNMFKWPQTREKFWRTKLLRNREVDITSLAAVQALGWRTAVAWECAVRGTLKKSISTVLSELDDWLQAGQSNLEIGSKI
ncbi:MAG: very short patch repair endonuclease [Novosphingobium sp.]|nr:very short patch repair endonuclease [Novosphingobium sp.]